MAGRPPAAGSPTGGLRVEVLKELQQLIDDREFRERLERGPLAETKGKEHWVLHLLLRATEFSQQRTDNLIGSAYSNLLARLQTVEDRVARIEELEEQLESDLKSRTASLEGQVGERVDKGIVVGLAEAQKGISTDLLANVDAKWKPISESIETFRQASRQLTKDVSDTYLAATQVRLLLNENARRITDLGRDIVALEESLKLVVARTVEEAIVPLEQRVSVLEGTPPVAPETDPEGTGSKPRPRTEGG